MTFRLDHLVHELPTEGALDLSRPAAQRCTWFEVTAHHVKLSESPLPAQCKNVVLAVHGHQIAGSWLEELADAPIRVTHVQFESSSLAVDATRVEAIRRAGFVPIPARHLSDRESPHLGTVLNDLCGLGASIIKVAVPVGASCRIDTVVAALASWPSEPALSLTPLGSRQGRVAAALAGSRLVFAPNRTTSQRMSADWYVELLKPAPQGDEGVDTWLPRA